MLAKFFFTVSSFTLLSRITGFLRDILIAAFLGVTPIVEAFFVALKLPNLFRRFFAEGAFNAAFIPLFSKKHESEGKEKALLVSSEILSLLVTVLLFITVVFEIFMPYVLYVVAPGFEHGSETYLLTEELARITFPYLFFISIATLFGAILNSLSFFGAVAFMPVLFNIAIISSLLILPSHFETEAHALAIGVFLAGILQLLWMIYSLYKKGYLVKLNFFKLLKPSDDLKFFVKKFLPGALGAGVTQINLWIDMVIATFFTGAIAYLYYADRVHQLPLSIIGTAMGTALLPSLSKNIANKDEDQKNDNFNKSILLVMFLTLPASFALVAIGTTIIEVLFQRGEFTAEATYASSLALKAYAVGLPAFALIKVFASCFFALSDTKTPVISAIYALVVNIVLNIALVLLFQRLGFMPHVGLALATSIAGWVNVLYLLNRLNKIQQFKFENNLKAQLFKIIICCLMMSVAVILLDFLEFNKYLKIIFLVSAGVFVYFIFSKLMKIEIANFLLSKILKKS